MKIFLTAKHWQLFIFIFAVPSVFFTIFTLFIMNNILSHEHPDPDLVFEFLYLIPFYIVTSVGGMHGWMWSIGTRFQEMMPESLVMKTFWFKVALLFSLFFILTISILVPLFIQEGMDGNLPFSPFLFLLLLPIQMAAIFCVYFAYYFVAKTYKTAELMQSTNVNDFIAEFFLIWFFPIGIWFMQPKINAMTQHHFLNKAS